MFTGIVQSMGEVIEIIQQGSNKTFLVESNLSSSFKTDQSISHDGVCLTVEKIVGGIHYVTAVDETLNKTTLDDWFVGKKINLEQCLHPGSRLDGHFVQGHVDTKALCSAILDKDGSWEFTFMFDSSFASLVIEKGSIALNGISLTTFNVGQNDFTVTIIPYTYHHTNMQYVKQFDSVNLEFDMIGKYILRNFLIQQGKTLA